MSKRDRRNALNDPKVREKARQAGRAANAKRKNVEALLGNDPWPEKQRRQMIRRLEQMPVSCRLTYMKAMRGKSLRAAITSHCHECMGWQRQLVAGCTAYGCPLYPYRPSRVSDDDDTKPTP